jgi:hypothetical protein
MPFLNKNQLFIMKKIKIILSKQRIIGNNDMFFFLSI